jgi:hypothetical protein
VEKFHLLPTGHSLAKKLTFAHNSQGRVLRHSLNLLQFLQLYHRQQPIFAGGLAPTGIQTLPVGLY